MVFSIGPSVERVVGTMLDALGGARFQLDLDVENRKVERLYTIAKRDQWNLDDRRAHFFPPRDAGTDVNAWLNVTDDQRKAAARCFSSVYYGEQGAKVISAQLTTMAPTNEASKFLATQVMDEARHVEVFEGILRFIDQVHGMNPFLNALLTDIARTRHREEKLIGMNLLVEGLALAAFKATLKGLRELGISEQGYRAVGEPIEGIMRDESRHVGFGVVVLPDLLRGASRRRKVEIRLRQLAWLGLLYGSIKYHQRDQETMGVDHVALLIDLLSDHERRVAECEATVLVSTERMQALIPSVDRVVDAVLRRERRAG
ncbi:MAG: ferritin-like domain-containing protein [Planctomycetes bacterium]|nr:ferritin-like domain-containing protein [Planctomycetota bacterium]